MTNRSGSLTVRRGLAAALPLAVASWGAMALPAAALNDGNPAGNNGTVKIAPQGSEGDGGSGNSPHATCGFDVEWYGFDEGPDVLSTVSFTMLAPTSDASIVSSEPAPVWVGGDPAGGAGDFDGEASYTPAFAGTADPERGYHVKVTVRTAGSQGADTKHKVLWLQPCPNPDI